MLTLRRDKSVCTHTLTTNMRVRSLRRPDSSAAGKNVVLYNLSGIILIFSEMHLSSADFSLQTRRNEMLTAQKLPSDRHDLIGAQVIVMLKKGAEGQDRTLFVRHHLLRASVQMEIEEARGDCREIDLVFIV